MKKSNKLLLILIAIILMVPIIFTLLDRGNWVNAEKYYNQLKIEKENLDAESVYLETIPQEQFNSVRLNGDNLFINIEVVKSDRYAIKIDKRSSYIFQNTKIENETLYLNGQRDLSATLPITQIVIFSPSLDHMHLENANIGSFAIDVDSLDLALHNVSQLNIFSSNIIKHLNMFVHGSETTVDFTQATPRILELTLDESKVHAFAKSEFNDVKINLNNSRIELDGKNQLEKNLQIHNLHLNALGNSKITVDQVELRTVTGTISPNTESNLPSEITSNLLSSNQ